MNALSAEFCRIERWRGYISSSFYVRLPDESVLESPPFRWGHTAPPPDDGPARVAYDKLVGRLEAAGWTRHADGADWFATAFTRLAENRHEIPLLPDAEVVQAHSPPVPFVPSPRAAPHEHAELDLHAAPELRPAERPPEPVPGRRRSRVALAAGVALVAVALASALVLRGHDSNGKSADARPAVPRQAARVLPSTTSPATALSTKTVAQASEPALAKQLLVDVRFAAHGNGSWVEVRRTSATGPVLYQATLTDGQTLHFRAPKLWARFGAASNLTITSNGRLVQLQGTYDKLFVPRR